MKERQTDLVSIIVPVYNVEQYLPYCLESITNQTYWNIEVFLIDDGSTDRSGAICDEYGQKDSRFCIIHQNNRGLSEARNAGLSVASGEYISFVDSDDYLHPMMIETLYDACIKTGCKISMIDENIVHDSTSIQETIINQPQITRQEDLVFGLFETSDPNIQYKYSFVWNKLYHKSVIEGLSFNHYLSEDLDFNIRAFLRVDKLAYVKAGLYYYLQREDSITRNDAKLKRRVDVIPEYFDFLNLFPSNSYKYRAYCLKRQIKMYLRVKYNNRGTPVEEYVKQRLGNLKTPLIKELRHNPSISLKEKTALGLFIIFPFLYTAYRWVLETAARRKTNNHK